MYMSAKESKALEEIRKEIKSLQEDRVILVKILERLTLLIEMDQRKAIVQSIVLIDKALRLHQFFLPLNERA